MQTHTHHPLHVYSMVCVNIYVSSGFNPQWNENFKFNVHVPELAMVRFVIEDYDSKSYNDFVAQYTLPFTSLQLGEYNS